MRTINLKRNVLVAVFFISIGIFSQEQKPIYAVMAITNEYQKQKNMKTFVIEREIPDAGALSSEQLQDISKKSNEVIANMGHEIKWLHSYITDNKVYCVYKAQSKDVIREHAEKGGFPANKISELSSTIDPTTAKN